MVLVHHIIFKQFGGGGAGGFRTFYSCGTANPLSGPSTIPISVQAYPITVGSGGAGAPTSGSGTDGSNSVFFNYNIYRWWSWTN